MKRRDECGTRSLSDAAGQSRGDEPAVRRLRRRLETVVVTPTIAIHVAPGSGTSAPAAVALAGADSVCPKCAASTLKSVVSTLPSALKSAWNHVLPVPP